METLTTTIFSKLIEGATCDTGNDLETIGFSSKYNNYEMTFYTDNGDVIVEDFGFMLKSGWKQLEATKDQVSEMQKIVDAKYDELAKDPYRGDEPFTYEDYTHFSNLIYA